jgi:hypothetical protein
MLAGNALLLQRPALVPVSVTKHSSSTAYKYSSSAENSTSYGAYTRRPLASIAVIHATATGAVLP